MTELPLSPDDEIVSAVLDGEATAAERARVAAEPALQQRLAELQQVQAAVAEPVATLDELSVRRLLDRALDTADGAGTGLVDAGGRPGPVRTDRRWWQSGVGIGIGSAAAVVLLALLAGPAMLDGLGGDDSDSADGVAATSADDAPPNLLAESARDAAGEAMGDADDSREGATEDESVFGGDGAAPDPEVLQWIGAYDTPEAFGDAARAEASAVRSMLERSDAPTTTLAAITAPEEPSVALLEYAASCPSTLFDDLVPAGGRVLLLVSGLVDDRELLAVAVLDSAGDLSLIGIDATSCERVDLS